MSHLPMDVADCFGFKFPAISSGFPVHDGLAPARIACFANPFARSFLASSSLSLSTLAPSDRGFAT